MDSYEDNLLEGNVKCLPVTSTKSGVNMCQSWDDIYGSSTMTVDLTVTQSDASPSTATDGKNAGAYISTVVGYAFYPYSAKSTDTYLTDMTMVTDDDTDTQAITGYDAIGGNIVVLFRGTTDFANVLVDIDTFKVDYPACNGCEVHKGFYDAYLNLKS